MRVHSISMDQANDIWLQRKQGKEVTTNEEELMLLGSEKDEILTDNDLDNLVEKLESVKAKYKSKKVSKRDGGIIDSLLPEIVHSELSKIVKISELSQISFWRWLSNVANGGYFWNFIEWRIGGNKAINWGITSESSIREVYFYRAWLRGHKMIEPGKPDPYKYARKGLSDMWRSQILRQEFGRDVEFVKAFLDTVYDNDNKTIIAARDLRTTLIPAIRAWTSGGSFSHLSYSENLKLLESLKNQEI